MPARIITRPMKEKCSPVDSEVNPVTVTAEVAVNAASTKGVDVPSAEANGMAKSTVKTAMTRENTEAVARAGRPVARSAILRSEEHTSELQSRGHLVCRLLLEKKKKTGKSPPPAK